MSNLDITFCSRIHCSNLNCERNLKTLSSFPKNISISDFENCKCWIDDKYLWNNNYIFGEVK